jgi:hypothetical protein
MNPFCLIPFLCLFLPPPPVPIAPDGMGGAVSFYASRVMPDGTLRSYDPVLDGVLLSDGRIVPFVSPSPYPPAPYPQGRVTVGPLEPMNASPRVHRARPHSSGATPRPQARQSAFRWRRVL